MRLEVERLHKCSNAWTCRYCKSFNGTVNRRYLLQNNSKSQKKKTNHEGKEGRLRFNLEIHGRKKAQKRKNVEAAQM